MKAIKPVDQILSDNTSFLKNKYKIEVSEINKKLSNVYWTPKLDKNPTNSTFIIALPKCSVKPFSKVVAVALKLIYKQI